MNIAINITINTKMAESDSEWLIVGSDESEDKLEEEKEKEKKEENDDKEEKNFAYLVPAGNLGGCGEDNPLHARPDWLYRGSLPLPSTVLNRKDGLVPYRCNRNVSIWEQSSTAAFLERFYLFLGARDPPWAGGAHG